MQVSLFSSVLINRFHCSGLCTHFHIMQNGYSALQSHAVHAHLANIYSFYTVQSATRGTVYGIGQSLGSLGRSVGPLIGTPLFAWSERNGM